MIRALCVACATSHASYRIVLRLAGTNVAAPSQMTRRIQLGNETVVRECVVGNDSFASQACTEVV